MTSENDGLGLEDFLVSLNSESTRKLYHRGIAMFSEFCKKSVDEILEERKQDLTPKANESIIDAEQRANRFERPRRIRLITHREHRYERRLYP